MGGLRLNTQSLSLYLMPSRAASHPLRVSVPFGIPLYTSDSIMPAGTVEAPVSDTVIYRHKRGGKWADKAVWDDRFVKGVLRRVSLNWRDCVRLKD